MNPYFLSICCATLLIIPMLFYISTIQRHKPLLKFCQFYIVSLLISVTVFFSGALVYIFGTNYNYQNIPSPIKEKISLFLQEATKRGINTSRIQTLQIKYLPWTNSPALFSGACNIKDNVLLLPQRDIETTTIFHELGHCVLQYEHYLDEKYNKEIMYYASSEQQSLSKESLDNFFHKPPQATLIAKNTEVSLKVLLNPILLFFGLIISYVLWLNLQNLFCWIFSKK